MTTIGQIPNQEVRWSDTSQQWCGRTPREWDADGMGNTQCAATKSQETGGTRTQLAGGSSTSKMCVASNLDVVSTMVMCDVYHLVGESPTI